MCDKRYIETFLAGKPEIYREDCKYYIELINLFGESYNEYNYKVIDNLYSKKLGEKIIGFVKYRNYIQIFGINTERFFTINFYKSKYLESLREYKIEKIFN